MRNKLSCVCLIGLMVLVASLPIRAQVSTGPGGVNFDEAGKINPASKDFHTNDGVLTIAYVTHTAGNGFLIPVMSGRQQRPRPLPRWDSQVNILRPTSRCG